MQHWGIPSRFKPSRECGISAKAIINTGSRKRVGKHFRAGASGARQASQSKSGSPEPGFFLWNSGRLLPVCCYGQSFERHLAGWLDLDTVEFSSERSSAVSGRLLFSSSMLISSTLVVPSITPFRSPGRR